MKHFFTLFFLSFMLSTHFLQAQNVGVGEVAPGSKLSVKGNLSVGNSYSNISTSLPVNGLIVEGSVGIGTPNPSAQLHTTGSLRFQSLGAGGVRYMKVDNSGNVSASATIPWGDLTGVPPFLSSFTELDPTWNGAANTTGNIGRTGSVGIGTLSPISTLQVAGNLSVGSGSSNGQTGMVQILTGGASPISNRLTYGTDGTGWKFAIAKNQAGTITEQLTIQDNGNVGIGTNSPTENLHIKNNGDASLWLEADVDNVTESDNAYIKLTQDGQQVNSIIGLVGADGLDPEGLPFTSAANNALLIGMKTAFPLQLGTNGTARLTILSSGDIGIGTSSPSAKLHIAAPSASFLFDPTPSTSGYSTTFSMDNVGLNIGHNSASRSFNFLTGGLTRMTIGGNGNIGIGTTAPSAQLHTTGTVRLQNLGGSGNRYVRTDNNGLLSATATVPWTDITGAPAFVVNEVDPTWSGAANTTGNVGRTGNVGIGIAAPTEKLHVLGNIKHSGSIVGEVGGFTSTWMQFDGIANGNSLILGAGGLTAIGAGESSTQVKNNIAANVEDLYLVADNGVKIVTSLQAGWATRVDAVDILANGNVGINTAAPSQKLHVEGGNILINNSGRPQLILSGMGSPMTIANDGARTWIHGNGDASVRLNVATNYSNDLGVSLTYTPGTIGAAEGNFQIGQTQKNNANFTHGITTMFTNGTERMRIGSNGNVSIGTTNLPYKLEVVGDIRANGGWLRTAGNTGWISDTHGGGWNMQDATWIRTVGSKSIYQNAGIMRTDGTLQVGSNGSTLNVVNGGNFSYLTNVLFANTAGNVGVGTAAPATKLHVVGETRVSTLAGTGDRMVFADANGTLKTVSSTSPGVLDYTPLKNGINWNAFFTSGTLGGGEGVYKCSAIQTITIPVGDIPAGATIAIISFRHADANESSAALKVYSGLTTSVADIVGQIGQAGRAGDGQSYYSGGTVHVPINASRQFRVSGCRQNGVSATWQYLVVATF